MTTSISEQTFVNAFKRALDATKDKVFWVQDQCSKTHSIQSYLYAELESQINHAINKGNDKIQLVAEFHKMDAAYIKRNTLEVAAQNNTYPPFCSYFAEIVVETENDWRSIEHELINLFTNQVGLLVIITYCDTAERVQNLASNYVNRHPGTETKLLLITKTAEPENMPERYTDGWTYCKLSGTGWTTLSPTQVDY